MRAVRIARSLVMKEFFNLFNNQKQTVESLKETLAKSKSDPRVLAETHLSLSKVYMNDNDVLEALPHARDSFEFFSTVSDAQKLENAFEASKILMNILLEGHQFREALRPAAVLESQAKRFFAPDDPQLANTLLEIALVYEANFKYKEASRLYQESAPILQANKDWDELISCYHCAGDCALTLENDARAIEAYSEAVRISEETETYSLLPDCFLALGKLYRKKEEWNLIETNAKKALEFGEKVWKKADTRFSDVYSLLVDSSLALKNYEQAYKFQKTKREFDLQVFPIDKVRHASNTFAAGIAAKKSGQVKDALELLDMSLHDSKTEPHYRISAYYELADTQLQLKDYERMNYYADLMMKEANSLPMYSNISDVCLKYGAFKVECKDFPAAVEAFRKAFSENSMESTANAYRKVAKMMEERGDIATSVQLLRQGRDELQQSTFCRFSETADYLFDLAMMEIRAQQFESAESSLRSGLEIKRSQNKANEESAHQAMKVLAEILIRFKKFGEAETMLMEAANTSNSILKREIKDLWLFLPLKKSNFA